MSIISERITRMPPSRKGVRCSEMNLENPPERITIERTQCGTETRAWAEAKEIAKARLPGRPNTKRGVAKRAKFEAWEHRPRVGRGGGIDFSQASFASTDEQRTAWSAYCARMELQALPVPAVGDLGAAVHPLDAPVSRTDGGAGTISVATEAETAAVALGTYANRKASLWMAYDRADEKGKGRAKERLPIVRYYDDLYSSGLHTKEDARSRTAEKFDCSASSLKVWLGWIAGVERDDWLAALLDQHHGRPRPPAYDERIWLWWKSDFLRLDRPTATACFRRAIAIAREQGIEETQFPALITLKRRLRAQIPGQSIKAARYVRKRCTARILRNAATVHNCMPCNRSAGMAIGGTSQCAGRTARFVVR
jgi:putative transposase